jgi:hypothetical protein
MLWYHLVRSSSYCSTSKWLSIVSGHSWDAGSAYQRHLPRARLMKKVNLAAVFARAAYKRPSAAGGKLSAGVANGWVNRLSPSPACADSRVSTKCSSLAPTEACKRVRRRRITIAGWWLNAWTRTSARLSRGAVCFAWHHGFASNPKWLAFVMTF